MRKGKALRFERLENRRLLAADLGYDVMNSCEAEPPAEACMIAPDILENGDQEICVDPIAPDQGPTDEPGMVDPAVSLDLSDGMDGYFGSLDSEGESDSIRFTAHEDGMVDIVVASSFGEGSTNLGVSGEDGNLIAASETENLEGFGTLSFFAEADKTYELVVSSEDGGEGNFQVTIGLEPNSSEFTDASANGDDTVTDGEVVDESIGDDVENDSAGTDVVQPDGETGSIATDQVNDEQADQSNADPIDEIVDEELEEESNLDEEGMSDELDLEIVDEAVEEESVTETEEELFEDETTTDSGPEVESDIVDVVDVDDSTDVLVGDETGTIDCADTPEVAPDLHADEIGADATVIDIVDRTGTMQGDLETVDDTDVFKFTSPASGEITVFAGELSEENVNLDINVYDSGGNLLVEGATNEIVKISFTAEQDGEYFVMINSAEDQNGSYEVLVEVSEDATVDDHANEIGDDATVLDNATGTSTTNGVIEVDDDSDAFQFTTNNDGEVVVNLQVDSEDHVADAQVSVYRDGELVADGSANETVGLRFDAAANVQYQILVDSANDTPMNYELTTNEFPAVVDSIDGFVEAAPAPGVVAEETQHDHDPVVCTFENDCADEDVTDEVFSEIGDDELAASDLAGEDASLADLMNSPDFQWAFSFDGNRFYSRFNGI